MKAVLKSLVDMMRLKYINVLFYMNLPKYMRLIVSFYKQKGMVFPNGQPNYISNSVTFDGTDYSLINIGNGVTLSMDVSILTHDGSVKTLYIDMLDDNINQEAIKVWHKEDMCRIRGGGVTIGDHTFVGAKSFLLPGTIIGHHCLIGAGSVVKGKVPDYAIVYGNPATIKGDTRELVERRLRKYMAAKQL